MKKIAGLIIVVFLTCVMSFGAIDPPKVYVAKLSQDSGAPYVYRDALENTLGDVSWERITEGRFRMVCLGCFAYEGKIVGLREYRFMENGGKYRFSWDDETENPGDSLILETYTSGGVLSDNLLSLTDIRIVVYPPDV